MNIASNKLGLALAGVVSATSLMPLSVARADFVHFAFQANGLQFDAGLTNRHALSEYRGNPNSLVLQPISWAPNLDSFSKISVDWQAPPSASSKNLLIPAPGSLALCAIGMVIAFSGRRKRGR